MFFRLSAAFAGTEFGYPLLVEYFIDRYARKAGKNIGSVDKKTLQLLESYPWPGNIRELQNVIERSLIVCETDTSQTKLTVVADPRREIRRQAFAFGEGYSYGERNHRRGSASITGPDIRTVRRRSQIRDRAVHTGIEDSDP